MRKIFTLTFLLVTTVLALQAQTLYQEDFEAGFAGWTAENLWMHGAVADQASQYFNMGDHTLFMAANDDAAGNGGDASGRLISPAIDLSGISNPYLTFEAYFVNLDYQGGDETATVYVSKDNGATWDTALELAGSTAGWTKESVDMQQYAGTTVLLAFEYTDGNQWNYGLAIDNVVIFQPEKRDVEVSFFYPKRYEMLNTTVPVNIQVTNLGYETIDYLEINWTDGTNTYTDVLDDLNITPFRTYTHNHSTSFTGGTEVKQYDLKVWTAKPNLQADLNPNNDVVDRSVSFIMDSPKRRVVAEEATGTWCPWCPRGAVFLERMIDQFPDDFIGIAVHNNDPMDIGPYDAALGDFPDFPGYPSVLMNRNIVVDPADIPTNMATQTSLLTPLTVNGSAEYDPATRNVTMEMSLETVTQIHNGDLRVSAVVTEDGVTGTGNGYAQANNYAGGGQGAMGGYENLANPVPASQMVYDHVARELIGGWEGLSELPYILENGAAATHRMTYTLPAEINADNMHVVMMITDPVTAEVYDGIQVTPKTITYPLFTSTSTSDCGPMTVTFTDNSDSTSTRLWTFEGGTPATSTDANPVVTYSTAGTYDVKLEATTALGNTFTLEETDLISVAETPVADFAFTIDNDMVTFANSAMNANDYTWDFGDGEMGNTANPTHVYEASGTYMVTLTAKNPACDNSITKAVDMVVYPRFSSSVTRGCGPVTVTFTDNSDSTTTRAWTFEGGTPATSTEANPTVTFANAGVFDVTLEGTTMSGNVYTISSDNEVRVDETPVSDFTFVEDNESINFSQAATGATGYSWDFGDGTGSASPNPSHDYVASGVYTVSLTVFSQFCEHTITKEVTFIKTGLQDLLQDEWNLVASPNPFNDVVAINYNLAGTKGQSQLVVYNYMGQELLTEALNNQNGTIEMGADLPQGIFFVQVRQGQKVSEMLKITKVK